MRNVTTLDVGDGVAREIGYISVQAMAGKNTMIELYDDRLLSEIAADFEGRDRLIRKDSVRPDVETVYSGYTKLSAIRRNEISGAVVITLTKP